MDHRWSDVQRREGVSLMTGIKHDHGKPRLSLIDPKFLESVAHILDQGERRYGVANWKGGIKYSRLIDAARRHLAAIEQGEDIDPDSGLPHASHVTCNMMFLEYYGRNNMTDWDDRHFKKSPIAKCSEDPVTGLQKRILDWADRIFPNRTAHGALCKLMLEEIPELLHGGLSDPLEYADILILVLDIASLNGIDAIAAAHQKMEINEQRKWKINTASGLMHHVKEGDNGGDQFES